MSAVDPKKLAEAYRKRFGEEALVEKARRPEPLPFGIPEIDWEFLEIGGFPRGCIVEVSGPESSGKSALMYRLIAETQRRGEVALLADAEGAFDPDWAAKIGVDVEADTLQIVHFDTTEDCFEKIRFGVASGVSLAVIDSVARLEPRAFYEDEGVGLGERARTNRRELGRLINGTKEFPVRLRDSRCCVVGINHVYERIGVAFGDPFETPGGRAWKFDAHLRVRMLPAGWSREKDARGQPLRQKLRLKTLKSRLGWMPKREVEVWVDGGGRFEVDPGVLVDMAVRRGLASVHGSWLAVEWKGETKKFQKGDFARWVQATPEFGDLLGDAEPAATSNVTISSLLGGEETP